MGFGVPSSITTRQCRMGRVVLLPPQHALLSPTQIRQTSRKASSPPGCSVSPSSSRCPEVSVTVMPQPNPRLPGHSSIPTAPPHHSGLGLPSPPSPSDPPLSLQRRW